MLALAGEPSDGWLSVPAISSAMSIPERFLPRVMADLVRAGLVVGHRGRTGGYRLSRAASSITLLDIIDAAEPDAEDKTCILRGGPCGANGRCAVHDAFTGARDAMTERLGATPLSEVVRSGLR